MPVSNGEKRACEKEQDQRARRCYTDEELRRPSGSITWSRDFRTTHLLRILTSELNLLESDRILTEELPGV